MAKKQRNKEEQYLLVRSEGFNTEDVVMGDLEHCREHILATLEYSGDISDIEEYSLFKIAKQCDIKLSSTVSVDGDRGQKTKK